jgi:NAD(P)-dependent dehydrogenase (short-subunit alcohol dehydrogenase family)
MAGIFITGSSTGLGLMAGQLLIEQGHKVTVPANSDSNGQAGLATVLTS